jgi:seryl-tRNA synthetase
MIRETIEFDQPVPEPLAGELAKRVFYVSDAIVDFSLVRSDEGIVGVEVVADSEGADLGRKLRFVVANDVLPQQLTEPKVLWRSSQPAALHDDVFARMRERGMAFEAGEGQIAVAEPVLGLMDDLDACIRDIALRELGAVEYRYPTLIPVSAMTRCGYLGSFPQQLMFMTRLHADLDSYTAFLEDAEASGDAAGLLAYCRDVDYCLPPTMCFHTYHQLHDGPLPAEALVVTSRGKSFRFETRYRRTLERLWDFTIREIVFLGSREFVLRCRQRFLDASLALVERLGLTGRCEVANDAFFLKDSADHAWSQRFLELKYELRLNVDAETTIAVGSFNFHERFFADSFRIGSGGADHVHTACVGFGLERLAYAFLCHHGIDAARWPEITAPQQTALRAGGG